MKSILLRAATLLLCLATLLSCASCVLLSPLNQDPETVYGSLLAEYASLLKIGTNDPDLSSVEAPTEKGLSDEVFDSLKTFIPEVECINIYSDMGYAFYDLDRDGTYECFLMKEDGTLYALYACKNGKPYPVEIYRGGTVRQGVLMENGTVFTCHIIKEDDKLVSSEYHFSRFEGGEMVPFRSYVINYESDTAYAIENGEKRDFSSDENSELNYFLSGIMDTQTHKIYAKEAGLWFRSINTLTVDSSESDTETPDTAQKAVFDASSYETILTSVTAMMPLAREYNYGTWTRNGYDDAMVIGSPEDYRIYINLLHTCANNNGYLDGEGTYHPKTIGYAYRDLNGDSSDELFILNEDSDLIALFTLREGRPHMVWCASDCLSAALDEKGRLKVSRYPGMSGQTMEYIIYELTPDGDLSTVEYLYGGHKIRKIMINGQQHIVDMDTFRTEYERIFGYHVGEFWDNSWNEGGKMLTFTPLPEK